MRHTVEIRDSVGSSMQLSVSVDNFGPGGSWWALTKGMIKYYNGPLITEGSGRSDGDVALYPAGADPLSKWHPDPGIYFEVFLSYAFVNHQGTGILYQPWAIG